MGRIGLPEIVFIALVVIALFGVKKIPEIGSAIGKAIKEFKKAGKEIESDIKEVTQDENNDQQA